MMGKVLGVGVSHLPNIYMDSFSFSISTFTSIYFGLDSVETSQIVASEQEIDKSKEMVMGFYEMFASLISKKL